MADGNRTTVHVDPFGIKAKLLDAGQRLCGESFVQLPKVDVTNCQARTL